MFLQDLLVLVLQVLNRVRGLIVEEAELSELEAQVVNDFLLLLYFLLLFLDVVLVVVNFFLLQLIGLV